MTFTELIFSLIITILVVIYGYYQWRFQYWKRRNLQHLKPRFPYGNVAPSVTRKEHMGFTLKRLYDTMKKNKWRHGGYYFFSSPIYMPTDLDYVKNIMTKDFQHFTDRGVYYNERDDPLSAHLFNIEGSKWKSLRAKLTPTFSSSKMKMMFPSMIQCEANLRLQMEKECAKERPIDIKEILGCFTTDIIGTCAFGLDCKTFEEPDSPFRKYGKKVFASSVYRELVRTLAFSFPSLAKSVGIALMPRDISRFFLNIVRDTVDYRKRNGLSRSDFLQLLIDLKNEQDGGLTIHEIAAQSFVFFIAGFETSSTTIAFALYELGKNQELQQKVRDEIGAVLSKHGGQITYEAILEMKYMNQVIDETLRKYPPAPVLPRKCVQDYKIPDQDIVIEKGTTVFIPVLAIHYDKDHYSDPEKFDPDRFSDENKKSRHVYSHIPFGEGPRVCIGMRFGLVQTKVGLTSLLKNFKFSIDPKTREPLIMNPKSLVLSVEDAIWLKAEKLS